MSEDMSAFAAAIQNFLGPVIPYLEDDNVSEVLINGPDQIFVEIGGKLKLTESRFPSEDELRAAVNNIAQSVGRRISEENPRLDGRLPDGSRIHAVIPPCSRNGTTLSIRKFKKVEVDFKQYIQWGAINLDGAAFLNACMFLGKNILVSGGTGSGKTTLLNLLCSSTPKGQRILVIEDASELDIKYEHVVSFETQMGDPEGRGKVSMQDLLKSALRLRPDRIIVGEVRGSEAMELVNAMNTGHKGCLGTIHSNSPADAIVRLESLAMGGDAKISLTALQYQISSAIDVIIQVSRLSDGSRRITEITEVLGIDEDENYITNVIYDMSDMVRAADGTMVGDLKPTGNLPSFIGEMEANRIPIPRSKFQKKKAA
ncbi:MAG: CpaF family protein [Bdellovibrionota bacterium]|nr:CpaF family protein [Bdellovibrionota bacterium]